MKINSLTEAKRYTNGLYFIMLVEREDVGGHRERRLMPVVGALRISNKDALTYTYNDRDTHEETTIEFPALEWSEVINNEVRNIVIEKTKQHNGFKTITTLYEV